MYKFLLCWRYLRTRYIALASIISVTLGVATMIVVNSVMAGFTVEMENRIHGILSDVVLESTSLEGMPDAQWHMEQIQAVAGPWIEAMTPTVVVPAMLSFQLPYGSGKWITRPVHLIGIDAATQGQVSDFSKYLQHPENRRQLSWELRHEGYDIRDPQGGRDARQRPQMAGAGWPHRIRRARYEEMLQHSKSSAPEGSSGAHSKSPLSKNSSARTEIRSANPHREQAARNPIRLLHEQPGTEPDRTSATPEASSLKPTSGNDGAASSPLRLASPLPAPEPEAPLQPNSLRSDRQEKATPQPDKDSVVPSLSAGTWAREGEPDDPFAIRMSEQSFDPTRQQHTGAVLGIGLVSFRDAEGDDRFVLLPGDDVKLTFPTAGTPPKAISDTFTIVDLYESKMSEYDSQFVFVPIEKLQELRGMIDPATGARLVSSIQIKLKPGVDGNMVRDLLRAKFRPELYAVFTWRDKQGPLLAAVQMETAILNVLLFLIICVSGFGILAIFFMIVVEKTRDIGILKSLGASSQGVMGIFLSYGLLLGLVGSAAGLVLGLIFVRYINEIADWLGKLTGRPLFDPQIYYFYKIPTIVEPSTVAWIMFGAVLIAVLASVLPALRAAMLQPVESLRYE
ncbi:MAG: FtsX-like permease family protein [Thermoguttaceae bacterium]|nr:FtsX-like permease family protein [Thermoguttaceae bacterium]MDW8039567.1 FtsX-like permease family protein [Thermoguttaceae bacterium]